MNILQWLGFKPHPTEHQTTAASEALRHAINENVTVTEQAQRQTEQADSVTKELKLATDALAQARGSKE